MLKRVIKRKPKQVRGTYAFIDSQNLNLGVRRMGWKISWRKLIEYLKEEHGVTKAFMFIGYMQENEDLYKTMHDTGYNVILKPTVGMFASEEELEDMTIKGNVDTDLVLEVMKQWPNFEDAIIISGDGDFFSLVEYLEDKGKLKKILTPNWRYSTLLEPFEEKIVRIDKLKKELRHYDPRSKTRKPSSKQPKKNDRPKNGKSSSNGRSSSKAQKPRAARGKKS